MRLVVNNKWQNISSNVYLKAHVQAGTITRLAFSVRWPRWHKVTQIINISRSHWLHHPWANSQQDGMCKVGVNQWLTMACVAQLVHQLLNLWLCNLLLWMYELRYISKKNQSLIMTEITNQFNANHQICESARWQLYATQMYDCTSVHYGSPNLGKYFIA